MKFPYSSKHPLPSALETRVPGARNQQALQHLKVDGLTVKYVGPGNEDAQAASIRANHPAPVDLPIYYFEAEVISGGDKGYIGVGLAAETVPLGRLPGWEPQSYGYHGDDGCKFTGGSARGTAFGPTYTTGDVIGVLWQRHARSITYYKNGVELGTAFTNVAEDKLYPIVGMRTRDEELRVNFGGQPFKTDMQGLLEAYQQSVMASIAAVQLPPAASGKPPLLAQLLFQHLVHQRCWRSAAVVARDVLGGAVQCGEQQVEEMKGRQAIYEAVASGHIQQALQQIEQRYGADALAAHPRLHFRLKLQQFIELLRPGGAGVEAALMYGRAELCQVAGSAADESLLQDAMSLLAYPDPAASPEGQLMHERHRLQLAEQVNDAIMGVVGGGGGGGGSGSVLERLYRQGAAAVTLLQQLGDLQACEVEARQLCLEQL